MLDRSLNQGMLGLFIDRRTELVRYATAIVGEVSLAEDVVQDAYLRLERAGKAEQDNSALEESVGYLFRVVRNLAIDARRKMSRETRQGAANPAEAIEQIEEDRPTPEAQAIARDDIRLLQQAMDELPERSRIALEMHRFGGYRLKDIAARLGVSTGTAHSLVSDAVDHCRMRLSRKL